jgi:hypothetical protein
VSRTSVCSAVVVCEAGRARDDQRNPANAALHTMRSPAAAARPSDGFALHRVGPVIDLAVSAKRLQLEHQITR